LPETCADALIVGAGMAGLSCASALAECGARVLVCESRPILGGRASSWIDPGAGAEIDDGPHLFAGAYREVRALLARVGAVGNVPFPERLRVPMRDRSGRGATLEWTRAPGLLGLAHGMSRFDVLTAAEHRGLARVLFAAWRGAPAADRPLGDWLDELAQGDAARRWLWHPLARAAFNEEPAIVSARLFAEMLRRLLLTGSDSAVLAHSRVGLSRTWAEPAATYVEAHDGRVLRGCRVTRVERTADGVRAHLEHGEPASASALCLAVPAARAHALAAFLPPADRVAIARAASVETTPIVSVNLWLDGGAPALEEPFVGFAGEPFAWCFDRTALVPSGAGTFRHVVLVAPGDRALAARRAADLIALARATLAAFAPATRDRRVVFARAVCERHAAPSLTPEAAAARPPVATGDPAIALAGDWIGTGLPATLEGAAWSGHHAAERLAAFLAIGGRGTVASRCSSSLSFSSF
jgi:squalene-associated FAD-dependent desaturase